MFNTGIYDQRFLQFLVQGSNMITVVIQMRAFFLLDCRVVFKTFTSLRVCVNLLFILLFLNLFFVKGAQCYALGVVQVHVVVNRVLTSDRYTLNLKKDKPVIVKC